MQLLSVARDIVENEGIGALTMSALAERSGASKPVVYEHFENSEAVAIALLEDYYETAANFVAERAEGAETIKQYVDIVIDALFEFQSQYKLSPRKITNGFSSNSLVNEVYLEFHKRSVDVYRGLLHQQGVSKAVSAVAAYSWNEMVINTLMEFALKPNSATARDTLKRMVSAAVQSLAAEPGAKPHTPSIAHFRARGSKPRKPPQA